MGNTPKIVHQRYVKLVTPSDAKKWFNVKPEGDAANILPMTASKE